MPGVNYTNRGPKATSVRVASRDHSGDSKLDHCGEEDAEGVETAKESGGAA